MLILDKHKFFCYNINSNRNKSKGEKGYGKNWINQTWSCFK